MSCNSISDLKRTFYEFVKENRMDVHPQDMEKMKDDVWLKSMMDLYNGEIFKISMKLLNMFVNRNKLGINDIKYNVKQDKKHSKAINLVGKDKKGFKLLFIDLSEVDKLENDKELFEHVIYWFERLYRQKEVEKISFAIHSGKEKSVEKCPAAVEKISDIIKIYPNFVNSIFVFDEYLGDECKESLKKDDFYLMLEGLPPIGHYLTFITESSYSKHFKLDERFEFSKGALTVVQKKTEEKNMKSEKTASSIPAAEEAKAVGVKDEVNSKVEIKDILSKLHTLESQVFELIRGVQELI